MAAKLYSTFTPNHLYDLGIEMHAGAVIRNVPPVAASALLIDQLKRSENLPLSTEKAKSEFIIAPILHEINYQNITKTTFFSGYSLNIDRKRGLTGRCDFIFSLQANALSISAPLFCVIEAKNHTPDDENNFAQCIAEMYAAKIFNERQNNTQIKVIYGAVSNGFEWIFLRLDGNTATVDTGNRYYATKLSELLGALQHIINQF